MTFTEDMALIVESDRNVNNIGFALKNVICKARDENRLVVGVYECAQMLQNKPEDVGLCLLPEELDDVTVQIHHKLIEAFCWENDIAVIQVKSFKNIGNVLTDGNTEDTSIGCMLIQTEKTDNVADDFINNYYSMLANQSPIIDLPE